MARHGVNCLSCQCEACLSRLNGVVHATQLLVLYTAYIYIFIRQKGSSNKWKKAPNTQQKQTNKREKKNYAQIGQASEQWLPPTNSKNVC